MLMTSIAHKPLLHIILFADTNVFFSHNSLDSLLILYLQLSLTGLWLTHYPSTLQKPILFFLDLNRKIVPHTNFTLFIDSIAITHVKFSKFLCVYSDEYSAWNEHIRNKSIKIAKNVGIISHITYLLPCNVLLSLYCSLVYPYLTYCNIAWASSLRPTALGWRDYLYPRSGLSALLQEVLHFPHYQYILQL